MTCNACGEKPNKTCNDFTKAVIEINNPEVLVLLRKVVIPASMGTEEQVPAAIGKYHNVILKYEANKHVYLYSSDGIPTLLEMDVPQEVWDSIDELQDEIDEMKNNPDVVDIVDTYADLESYDTSELGDKDVIRVLNDETHDGESTYYRWNLSSQTWTFIGGLGPYYTKSETDTLLDTKADKTTTYTKIEVDTALATKQDNLIAGTNISIASDGKTISATDTTYTAGTGLSLNGTQFSVDTTTIATQSDLTTGLATKQNTLTAGSNVQISNDAISATDTTYSPFTGTDGTAAGAAGLVPAPATADAGKVLGANGSWVTGGPTVVQTTGNSTTDVMSQNAVTNMVYARNNPASEILSDVRIGKSASVANNNPSGSVAIGDYAEARGKQSVALGGSNGTNDSADARSNYSIAIGHSSSSAGANAVALGAGAWTGDKSSVSPAYSVALGANSTTSVQGEVSFGGTKLGTNGYNNSQYRLLTNIYDPQSAHDAATKGYVDSLIAALEARIAALENT